MSAKAVANTESQGPRYLYIAVTAFVLAIFMWLDLYGAKPPLPSYLDRWQAFGFHALVGATLLSSLIATILRKPVASTLLKVSCGLLLYLHEPIVFWPAILLWMSEAYRGRREATAS